jgi:hypothetical protein
MTEWNIELCDWNWRHNADEQVLSEDENQISPLPLSSHELIGDAFMNHKLVGMYEYMGEYFMLFLLDQDLLRRLATNVLAHFLVEDGIKDSQYC